MFTGFRQDVVVFLFLIVVWTGVLALPFFSVLNLVGKVRAGVWRTPRWFLRVGITATYVAAFAWTWGFLSMPWFQPLEEACSVAAVDEKVPFIFDRAFFEANWEGNDSLFPLQARCAADFDFVPAWVNPTVGVCLLLVVASLIGIVWTAVRRQPKRT